MSATGDSLLVAAPFLLAIGVGLLGFFGLCGVGRAIAAFGAME